MSMQEIIQAEKERVQRALEKVTEPGATMSVFFPEGDSVRFEVDGFVVLRAMPQVDADGNVKQWRYDLMFKEVGYNNGMQYAHLISAATFRQDHERCARFADEHGNEYVANAIEPEIDPDRKKVFADWRAYKAANAEMFERIDRQLLQEYTRMACLRADTHRQAKAGDE